MTKRVVGHGNLTPSGAIKAKADPAPTGDNSRGIIAFVMSGAPAKRAATYEDLLRVPEHLVAEIIDGDLVTSPRPRLSARGGRVVAGRGYPPGLWPQEWRRTRRLGEF